MDDIVCVECKFIGKPKMRRRGSGKWEMMGWTLFFPLGVPYTIWRMLARIPSCGHCKGTLLLNADSVAGQRLIKIVTGETAYAVAPPISNVDIPVEPQAKIVHPLESKSEPVALMQVSTPAVPEVKPVAAPSAPPAIPDVKPEPVKEPSPAPKPIDDPKPPSQPSPPPVAPEPTPPAEQTSGQASERSVRLDPNAW